MLETTKIEIIPMQIQNDILTGNTNTAYVSFNFTETTKAKFFKIFKILLIILNTLLLGISVVLESVNKFQTKECSIFLIFTYFSTFYFISCIKRDQRISFQPQETDNFQHNSSKTNIIKSQMILAAFFLLLGFSDCLFNLTEFLNQLFLVVNNQIDFAVCSYSSVVFSLIQKFSRIFYQLLILLFILQYEGYFYVIRQRLYSKLLLGYLTLSFIVQWISIIVNQVYSQTVNICLLHNATTSNNITTFEKYDPIMYPLAIEFRVYCFIELLYLCFSIRNVNKSVKNHGDVLVDNDDNSDDSDVEIFDQLDYHHHQEPAKNDFYNLPITFGIFIMSCTIGFLFFEGDNFNHLMLIANEIFEVTILLICFTILLILIKKFTTVKQPKVNIRNTLMLSIWPLHRFKLKKRSNKHGMFIKYIFSMVKSNDSITIEAKIDSIVLNLSSTSLIVYTGLSISTIVDYINSSNEYNDYNKRTAKILALTTLCLVLIQTILQNFVINYLIYNHTDSRQYYRKSVKVLIIINFVLWLIDTFSAKKYFVSQDNGRSMWPTLAPVLIPAVILYRFQSCIILVKVLYEKYSLNMLPIQYRISLYRPITVISEIFNERY